MRDILASLALSAVTVACGGASSSAADTSPDVSADAAADTAADSTADGAGATPDDGSLVFGAMGPLVGDAGRGGFRFGAATAAVQIEDQLTTSDWWLWTTPKPEGLGHDTPVGDAVMGYTKALDDVTLLTDMHLDAYRFNVDWSRIEPQRGVIDEAALAHYDAVLDALVAAGIRPMLTIHHFSSPVWVDDPRDPTCEAGPTDANLCGWDDPVGGPLVVQELADHAALLADRFGDRVDEWATVNEPINYLFASYGVGYFPPGKKLVFQDVDAFIRVLRSYFAAHAALYDAIKAHDTADADGDGVAAAVGMTLSVADWEPARDNAPSDDPVDVAAAEAVRYLYHVLPVRAVTEGGLDADLDGTLEEAHPEWAHRLDWLGMQYYFRAGVTGEPALLPLVNATPCAYPLDMGACLPPEDPTWWVPSMHYEYYAPGLYLVLRDMGKRWPDLPLVVTEAGIATRVGRRRAENVVRTLEQIARAQAQGVDVRGYYHWSLMDNFEWAEGYGPAFGLYNVELSTYLRTPTEGATVLGDIAAARRVDAQTREDLGGDGPMTRTPEPAAEP